LLRATKGSANGLLPKGVLISSFNRQGVDSKGAARQIEVLKR